MRRTHALEHEVNLTVAQHQVPDELERQEARVDDKASGGVARSLDERGWRRGASALGKLGRAAGDRSAAVLAPGAQRRDETVNLELQLDRDLLIRISMSLSFGISIRMSMSISIRMSMSISISVSISSTAGASVRGCSGSARSSSPILPARRRTSSQAPIARLPCTTRLATRRVILLTCKYAVMPPYALYLYLCFIRVLML